MAKRVYHVQGDVPPAAGKSYGSHVRVIVIAQSVARAIALVEEKHPGVTVHNVQHHGIVDIEEPLA